MVITSLSYLKKPLRARCDRTTLGVDMKWEDLGCKVSLTGLLLDRWAESYLGANIPGDWSQRDTKGKGEDVDHQDRNDPSQSQACISIERRGRIAHFANEVS